MVKHHDDPKIPLLDLMLDGEILKGADKRQLPGFESGGFLNASRADFLFRVEDKLLQLLHEADALWMICEDGIEADWARFAPGTEPTRPKIVYNNVRLHHAEAEVYRHLLSEDQYQHYGFREGTLYRSLTGYGIFREALKRLDRSFGVD